MHFKGFKAFQLVCLHGCISFSLCVTSVLFSLCPTSPVSFLAEVSQDWPQAVSLRQWEQLELAIPPKTWRIALSPCEHSAVRWVGSKCVTRRWQTLPGSQILSFQFYRQPGNYCFIHSKETESCPHRLSSLIPGGDENRLFPDFILVCLWFASSSGCARSLSWGAGPQIR